MTWQSTLQRALPQQMRERLRSVVRPRIAKRAVEKAWRERARHLSATPAGLPIHLGCGRHYEWMLNCDYRITRASDVAMNCSNLSIFAEQSASAIFSHAFFEHLYRDQQLPLLRDCGRVLKKGAPLVFVGLPDFRAIADLYLKRASGIPGVGEVFDLAHVYRYTHGNPEAAHGWWLEQLHKSLFDKEYLANLLSNADFKSWIMFNYCYLGEHWPINLGFLAWKERPSEMHKVRIPFSDVISPEREIMVIDRRNCSEDVLTELRRTSDQA